MKTSLPRSHRISARLVVSAALLCVVSAHAGTVEDFPPTGSPPSAVDGDGKMLYRESHALLISASNYKGVDQNGWDPLPNTPAEMDRVAEALRKQGFHVRRIYDPTGSELKQAYDQFAAKYGRARDNRIVFFFSGHGYTDKERDVGYLVPIDAANPRLDEEGFFSRALRVQDIYNLAQGLVAKHALFVFDSCFSGSIFRHRGAEEVPQPEPDGRRQYFRSTALQPVRQFITAGRADETVPAKSVFVPLFVQALEGRATMARDGYVTGKEIGFWLEQQVPGFNPFQHAQSGLIRDPDLSIGDMVFQVPQEVQIAPVTPPPVTVPITPKAQQAPAAGSDEIPATKPYTFKDCSDCPEMVVVPAGRFTMGSPETEPGRDKDEGPTHEVVIARAFAVGKYEVTLGQFRQFVKDTQREMRSSCWKDKRYTPNDQHPVVCVSWNDAKAYAKWLTDKTGKPYRLLSEAEWEYVARARTITQYWWGEDVRQGGKVWANCNGCGSRWDGKRAAPIGSFEPNARGLYDTAGNVWEWVEDCWNEDYTGAPTDGSAWMSGNCQARVLRGGSWFVYPQYVRSAVRNGLDADGRIDNNGIRLARTLP